jgi:hypothetical protein
MKPKLPEWLRFLLCLAEFAGCFLLYDAFPALILVAAILLIGFCIGGK